MRVRSLTVAIVVLLMGMVLAIPAQAYPAMPPGVQGPLTVIKVVDGDTIWVDDNGQRMKIRMIGLDTPESVDPRKPVQCFALASLGAGQDHPGRPAGVPGDRPVAGLHR